MTNNAWGHCQHCKHFGSPADIPLANEEAPCLQPALAKHRLVVFGASGCSLFELRAAVHEPAEQRVSASR